MARRKLNHLGALSSAQTDGAVSADVRGIDAVSISCSPVDGAWPSGPTLVLAVEVSHDGAAWFQAQYVAEADGATTNVSAFTAAGVKRLIPVFDMAYIRVRVSTASGSVQVTVMIYGEGEDDPGRSTSGTMVGAFAVGVGPSGGGSGGGAGGSPDSTGGGSLSGV